MGAAVSLAIGLTLLVGGIISAILIIRKRQKDNDEAAKKNPKVEPQSVYSYWLTIVSFVGAGLGLILTIVASINLARQAKAKKPAPVAPPPQVVYQAQPPALAPAPVSVVYQAPPPTPQYQAPPQAPPYQAPAAIQPAPRRA